MQVKGRKRRRPGGKPGSGGGVCRGGPCAPIVAPPQPGTPSPSPPPPRPPLPGPSLPSADSWPAAPCFGRCPGVRSSSLWRSGRSRAAHSRASKMRSALSLHGASHASTSAPSPAKRTPPACCARRAPAPRAQGAGDVACSVCRSRRRATQGSRFTSLSARRRQRMSRSSRPKRIADAGEQADSPPYSSSCTPRQVHREPVPGHDCSSARGPG